MKKQRQEIKNKIIRLLPLILMVIIFIFLTRKYKNISIDNILNFTPSNYFLAAGILIFIYGVKSVSMFISLSVLYISAGIIFPSFWAIIINLIGLIVCMTIPYFIGRYSGSDLFNKLASKYPKIDKTKQMEDENKWLLVFTIKILGFIPNEIGSLALGSMDIQYGTYITAAVLGKTPLMIAKTLLGSNFNKPRTPGFKWSIIVLIIVLLGIGIFYRKNRHKFRL